MPSQTIARLPTGPEDSVCQIWVVSDGTPGMRLQAVAMAESLLKARPDWEYEQFTVTPAPLDTRPAPAGGCGAENPSVRHRQGWHAGPAPACWPLSAYTGHLRATHGRLCAGTEAARARRRP